MVPLSRTTLETQIIQTKLIIFYPIADVEDQRSSSWVVGPATDMTTGADKDGVPLPPSKPRIWSMAELAVSKSSYVGCG